MWFEDGCSQSGDGEGDDDVILALLILRISERCGLLLYFVNMSRLNQNAKTFTFFSGFRVDHLAFMQKKIFSLNLSRF